MAMVAMLGHGFSSCWPIHQAHDVSFSHSMSHSSVDLWIMMPHIRRSVGSVAIVPSSGLSGDGESRIYDLRYCSSHLRGASRNVRLMLSPLQAATLHFSQSLVSPKNSDSTLRTSNVNPDIEGSIEPEQSNSVKSGKVRTTLAQFKALRPVHFKASLESPKKRHLKRYTTLAGQLAGEGHMLEFAKLLEMLADAGLDKEIFTSKLDSSQLDAGLTLLLSRKQLDLFVHVMKKLTKAGYTAWEFAGKGSREVLTDELLLLLESGRTEYCVKVIESLTECGFLVKKLIDPARVIASCAKSRDLELAHRFVKLLSRNPWHYNLMIREFSYHHELQSSFDVLDIMKELGVAPDLYTYRALMDSCGRCNEPSKAAVVFEAMLKDGFKPNIFIYNSMMNVNVGDLDEVQRYYEHMQGAGITADLATFNILLKAYAASGRADLAAGLYFHIQQTGELSLDVVSYSTLINVFGRAKMWEEALRVKVDMLDAGITPNVVTWTSIIGACATAGLVEQSFREFDEMLKAGCRPNVNCYNMLLQACIMADQVERAFQLFQEWKQTGRIRSFTELVNHPDPLTRTHELIAVTDIFPKPSPSLNDYQNEAVADMDNENWSVRYARCKPNLVTYNCMMKACGSAPERIRSLMREMKKLSLVPDVKSWSILLDAYGTKGDLEGSLAALEEMRAYGFKPDVIVYTALMKACVQANQPDKAFEIFSEMKASGVRPNAVTYNTLLRGHRNNGQFYQVQRALALYEEMREAGHVPNDFILQGLIKEWAEGLSNSPSSSSSASEVDSEKGFLEYTEALVHKVAVHARGDSNAYTIDLHGLSKGEARTAVLAVLRIIKERYLLGSPVEEDLIIITGMGRRSEKGVPVIRDVVLGVLQKELGLRVLSVLSDAPERQDLNTQVVEDSEIAEMEDINPTESDRLKRRQGVNEIVEIRPRRPINSGRLKVTKESLNAWLGRKVAQTITDPQSLSY
ncbi:hypothetical protein KC19_8G069400 [Ceratodon purpureus]|uniref:Smr domain-containing protein n=1 Tax=Ceratodon purpureus TaxID=3225 RepID=A0A8T0H1H7_CERPU|nr:hypothetical protein KC19_8G069400 [Ceratodon purpureus]